ncbi:hypothetical protein SERLA73DRAFT_189254 [Serpula lacrymans var. lacrymans S7.3]|uniref:Glutaredoxin domain-containing protein n=2 Tax=Serpula lacrymans var. lacrymans TaxID=341189 RepID=F8QD74_SERL3|nr:uncharacterized protein SERLADRAFT_479985 [Serpula lacrymans var. lacrymans S7.9]EGN93545.1 hypothetical protein SERLA73DRAFT_189254 [Serpula lacrymans var. lacrymans S7.3]EGO18922.1 hypothetical protein SERLADRAFT_479985 [Serpula lacrymans var. lacrymans S7.9]
MLSSLYKALSSKVPANLFSTTAASSSTPSQYQNKIMAIKDLVETAISDNKVTIFSKTWCPYSARAKALFVKDYPGVPAHVLELDETDDGSAIQNYLAEKTGQRSVPNIFVNGTHVGGCDDLFAMKKADLKALVEKA